MNALRSTRKFGALVLALAILAVAGPVFAATNNNADTVTVAVGNVLSITDTQGDFTLTFTDTVNGSSSSRQTVIYTVQANNMPTTALTGAVSAKISAALSGVTIKGDPAATSTNLGSSGNIVLSESAANDISVGTTAVNLMDKGATTAPQGKVLNGNFGVSWVAVATRDLADTDGGNVTLTVTLKDA